MPDRKPATPEQRIAAMGRLVSRGMIGVPNPEPEHVQELRNLAALGLTQIQIVRRTGKTVSYVKYWTEKFGIHVDKTVEKHAKLGRPSLYRIGLRFGNVRETLDSDVQEKLFDDICAAGSDVATVINTKLREAYGLENESSSA